jgi:hypothetical protein
MTEQTVGHYVVRDGSVWLCERCKRTWPYPAPVPKDTAPCEPRPWIEPGR